MAACVLAFDSSTGATGVALVGPCGLLERAEEPAGSAHSRRLVPLAEELLGSAGLGLDALHGIAVASGPGSFTGIRIGVATANGLAYALGLPVVGVGSLEAFAALAPDDAPAVVAVLVSRRAEVYAARFERRAGRLERTTPDLALPPAEAFRRLVEPGDVVLGPGAERFAGELASGLPGARRVAVGPTAAGSVARIGAAILAGGGGARGRAEPAYVTRPDVELARAR